MTPHPTHRYAVSLDLRDKRVVVVGGGPVAARRARDLVAAGAHVEVISPWLVEDLADASARGEIVWREREFAPGDLTEGAPAWLVHTATGEPDVDAAVAAEAEAARIWCVRADDRHRSTAWRPATATGTPGSETESVSIAVTAGGDPRRATAIRDALWASLDSGTLPIRAQRAGDQDGARPMGSVALVGGGPGDEGLLTVRGRTLLAAADVVVTDRLGPRSVLEKLAPEVEIIDVGKTAHHHPIPQSRINEILVDRARAGLKVVRLKGGDPFVLGRGSEEAAYCATHAVPVEVVPGITSAISVPAAAGIPVTHRGVTSSFIVASGHAGASDALAAAKAAPVDATLILLMAVEGLEETARALIAAGRSAETPVAIIEWGWTPEQRTTVTDLAHAAATARSEGVTAPAIVVVGKVVSVRAQLATLLRT